MTDVLLTLSIKFLLVGRECLPDLKMRASEEGRVEGHGEEGFLVDVYVLGTAIRSQEFNSHSLSNHKNFIPQIFAGFY